MKKLFASSIIIWTLLFGGSFTACSQVTPTMKGNFLDIVTRSPWVDVRSYASINAAVTAIGSTHTTLVVANVQTLTASLTIPSTLSLEVLNGGSIVKASTYILTIKGPFEAGLYQVFSGFSAGDVTFGSGSVKEVYPEWWGAVSNNSSPAVMTKNVLAFISALKSMDYRIGDTHYWATNLKVDDGDWYINDGIALGSSKFFTGKISGNGRSSGIYQTNVTKPIFNFQLAYQPIIEKLFFYAGVSAIILNAKNTDMNTTTIRDCIFYNQTSFQIDAQSGFTSSLLNIERCDFSSATTMVSTYADYTKITNCWANASGDVPVFINNTGTMTITGLVGVPTNSSTNSCWIKNYAHVILWGNRFGSEDGRGRTVLEQRGSLSSATVIIKDNFCPTLDYAYKFYQFPENLTITGNYSYHDLGGAGCKGIWIAKDPSKTYMYRGRWEINEKQGLPFYLDGEGYVSSLAEIFAKKRDSEIQSVNAEVRYSDLKLSTLIIQGVIFTNKLTNVTEDTANYEFLGGPTVRRLSAKADNAYALLGRGADAYTQQCISPNVYTYVLDFMVVTTAPIQVRLVLTGTQKYFTLHNGLNILQVIEQPIENDRGGWQIEFSKIPNGAVIKCGRLRSFLGACQISTVNTIFHDLSSERKGSNGYLNYFKGDRVEYTNPASGGYLGEVITTSGANGTEVWRSYGPIS